MSAPCWEDVRAAIDVALAAYICEHRGPPPTVSLSSGVTALELCRWVSERVLEQSEPASGRGRIPDCKHRLRCTECGESLYEADAALPGPGEPAFDDVLMGASSRLPGVTSVVVEAHGGHERVSVWLDGQAVGALVVGEQRGQAVRELLLSGEIVLRARVLARHWHDQDGFNAAIVDELLEAVADVDRTLRPQLRNAGTPARPLFLKEDIDKCVQGLPSPGSSEATPAASTAASGSPTRGFVRMSRQAKENLARIRGTPLDKSGRGRKPKKGPR